MQAAVPANRVVEVDEAANVRPGIARGFVGLEVDHSWHAPEVACVNKGKARTPYEFGAKVSITTSVQGNLVVGARAFGGNPFDGHTLAEQLEQTTILLQDRGIKPGTVYVDLGYRGVDHDNPGVQINHRSKKRRLNEAEQRLLTRRQSIEPVIGHLKHDHRMDRYHLKGETGDRIHAVLCAAGYNIRWLLRMVVKKGLGPFLFLVVFGSLYNAMRWVLEHGRVLFGASDRRFAVGAA